MKYGVGRQEVLVAFKSLIGGCTEEIQKDPWLRVILFLQAEDFTRPAESVIVADFSKWRDDHLHFELDSLLESPVWQLMRYTLAPGTEGTLTISLTRSMTGESHAFAVAKVTLEMPLNSLLW